MGAAPAKAERRQLTVMFCDIVGSTALSARLDPEDLSALLGSYRACIAGTVVRFDGYVAQYMGDGVLVYFGYPQAHEDDAERAVRAALAIIDGIAQLSVREPLQVRLGIATGLVVVGDPGADGSAQERGVVGETPNLAARLQGIAEANAVVIAGSTHRLLGSLFEYRDLGAISLKGFAEPMRAWQVLRTSAIETRFDALHRHSELTRLVGRDEEVDLLLRRWRQAKEGEGRVVLFSGEPGIGKSRIALAVRERLAGEPHIRLLYSCSPHHRLSALHPFISQLERAARFKRDDAPERKLEALEALLADSSSDLPRDTALIAALLSIPTGERCPQPNLTPQQRREATLAALLAQLEGLAARQPVLMIFEDAHWIDPTSMELLERTVELIQACRVLLVVTARPEFAAPWAGLPHATIYPLSRLRRRDALAVIDRVAGGRPLPEEITERILERTDGVPLFLEELTTTLLDSGLLQEVGDRLELRGHLPPLAIPATLHDSLMARLDRLGKGKEVAQIGACIGREFAHELLVAVVPLAAEELAAALTELLASGLLFRRGLPPEASYLFKHALIQDIAYQSLLRGSRQQHHQRIARALEQRFPTIIETQPEILAQHYAEAGLVEGALNYWQRAGQLALQRSANVEAVTHCEHGLQLLSRLSGASERGERELALQMTIGPALVAARGFADPAVGRAYARAWELCQELGEETHLPIVLRGRQVFHRIRGELGQARAFAEQLMQLAERRGDQALLVGSCQALGQDLFQIGELKRACEIAERGIALFDPQQHRIKNWPGGQPGEQCYLYGAFALWMLGYPQQSLRRAEQALALAEALANPANTINTLAFVALIHVFRGEHATAAERAEATVALSTEQHNPFFLAWGTILKGWTKVAGGEIDGLADFERGMAAYRATGSRAWLPYFLGLQAESYRLAGRPDRGLPLVSEATALSRETGEGCWRAELSRIEGEFSAATSPGDLAAAERCFQRALDIARQQQARSWELRGASSLARLRRAQGRDAEARNQLAPVLAGFTEGAETADLVEAKALLDSLT